MEGRVLVAYATKYGATQEIAEKIGEIINAAGLPADVQAAKNVNDLTPYGAVVLGSAVYIGGWRKPAAKFLKENAAALKEREVWIFSSGPVGEGDPIDLLDGWRLPGKLEPVVENIQPHDVVVFHGAVFETKMNFIEKWMMKNMDSPVGDFRDWEAIAAWAQSIAEALK
jgi:menaquinone-dependent protoporphyrinogen oxidase